MLAFILDKSRAYRKRRQDEKNVRLETQAERLAEVKVEQFKIRQSTLMRQQRPTQEINLNHPVPETNVLIDQSDNSFDPSLALAKINNHLYMCKSSGDTVNPEFLLCLSENRPEAIKPL